MLEPTYIQWLVQHSMLAQAKEIARSHAGQGTQWRTPYAVAQPRAAAARAAVWFAAYPPSIVTAEGDSVLATLGSEALWQAFAEIGIEALHTGPMKVAGGITGTSYTPTIDGYFDRIGLEIDAAFGTAEEFVQMSATATAHGAVIIDDIVPGHTGKGADFRLAERGYEDYPGIYHMVEIAPADWDLVPDVVEGEDAVNLPPATVETLREKGYIVGRLTRVIFYEPGVKETNWSATNVIEGVDGVARRWVYLHYFKAGQPTLNWLDPSFAAARLVMGDALHSLDQLGVGMLRLDANGFLGIEPRKDAPAWSEGHPLSMTANQIIAGLVRKLGGFTFQELNLTVDDIVAMSQGGADLAYDFITRPAYHHALVTGNTSFLRLMLNIIHEYGIDPASLIHALQNHDELTIELVHFWTLHKDDPYEVAGETYLGSELRELVRGVMYERLTGDNAPYNRKFVTNGVACTTISVITAALDIRDLTQLTDAQKAQIQQIHLLLVMYNALQPGVFALSGWDLVGALPLPASDVATLLKDGDTRWINRGAYDLMNVDPTAERSSGGLPRATVLYGSLPTQLADPDSFASHLKRLLQMRREYRIFESRQLAVPVVESKSLLVMVHELPEGMGVQVTALNFGAEPVCEVVELHEFLQGASRAIDMFVTEDEQQEVMLTADGALSLQLMPYSGKSYLIR